MTGAWDRPLIGRQPFKRQVWLLGRIDEADTLASIVGWSVGCFAEHETRGGVANLVERGLVTTRRHTAPIGEWDAYALTDAGFERLAEIGYGDMHDRAVRAHQFYAANAQGRADPR